MPKPKNKQPYFPVDANNRNKTKIIQLRIVLGVAGYGVYFMLLERLRNTERFMEVYDLETLAFDFRVDQETIASVIEDFGLFATVIDDDGCTLYYSPELNESMGYMVEAQQRRREAAAKAAAARWGKQDPKEKEEPIGETQQEPTETFSLKEEINNISQDTEWLSGLGNRYGLTQDQIQCKLKEFHDWCQSDGYRHHESMQDAKSHFNRWLGKQSEDNTSKHKTNKSKPTIVVNITDLDRQAQRQREMHESRTRNAMKPSDYIRSKGYDPSKVTLQQVMSPDWCKENPPTIPILRENTEVPQCESQQTT